MYHTLFEALKLYNSGKTIQQGLSNVIKGVKEGDYLTAGTLTTILNAPKNDKGGEADVNILLKGIDRLTKTDDNTFTATLKGDKISISQSFSDLAGISISVKNNATVKIEVVNSDKVIVKTEGVKAGWFGLPDIKISGNEAEVLGFSFTLYK